MKKIFPCFLTLIFCEQSSAQNVGIGTATPVEKLQVTGNIKADTIKPAVLKLATGAGIGKVLVSDANGNASWQTLGSSATGSSKFMVPVLLNSNTIGRAGFSTTSGASVQVDSADFGTPRYNLGTDFLITTAGTVGNKIVINNDGLYHFEGSVKFNITHLSAGLSPNCSISLLYNTGSGNVNHPMQDVVIIPQIDFLTPFNYSLNQNFSIDIYFPAGTTISMETRFSNLTNYPLSGINVANTFFSGYRIAD